MFLAASRRLTAGFRETLRLAGLDASMPALVRSSQPSARAWQGIPVPAATLALAKSLPALRDYPYLEFAYETWQMQQYQM